MSTPEIKKAAFTLYEAPFRYEHGYIFDAKGQMVSDDGDVGDSVARVRGWGRIGYLPDGAKLQDEIGKIMAEALTEYWRTYGELYASL